MKVLFLITAVIALCVAPVMAQEPTTMADLELLLDQKIGPDGLRLGPFAIPKEVFPEAKAKDVVAQIVVETEDIDGVDLTNSKLSGIASMKDEKVALFEMPGTNKGLFLTIGSKARRLGTLVEFTDRGVIFEKTNGRRTTVNLYVISGRVAVKEKKVIVPVVKKTKAREQLMVIKTEETKSF